MDLAGGRRAPVRERRRARRARAYGRAGVRRSDALAPLAAARREGRLLRRELRVPAHAGPVPGRARALLRTGRVLGDVSLPLDRALPLGRPAAPAREARGDVGRDDRLRRAAHGARARARLRVLAATRGTRVPAHAGAHREWRAGPRRGRELDGLPEARRPPESERLPTCSARHASSRRSNWRKIESLCASSRGSCSSPDATCRRPARAWRRRRTSTSRGSASAADGHGSPAERSSSRWARCCSGSWRSSS